jgi:hypothetical protein
MRHKRARRNVPGLQRVVVFRWALMTSKIA